MPSARRECGRDKRTHSHRRKTCGRFVSRSSFSMPSKDTHSHTAPFLRFSFILFYFFSTSTHSLFVIYNSSAKLRTSHFSNLCKGMFSYRRRHICALRIDTASVAVSLLRITPPPSVPAPAHTRLNTQYPT